MGEISTITLLDGVTYDIKDAKSRMTILKYGSSTWDEFIAAYDNKAIVYCRASSNSDPGTGSQTRLAFMADVNNETTPTEVEFQYYRSVSSHSDSQQGDQVYVYKLNKTNGWSVTTRNAFTKVIAGTGLTSSFTTGTSSSITLSFDTADASDIVYDNTASGLSSTSVQGAIDEVSSDINKSNAVFINFSATGHFLDEEYEGSDGWWTFDSITDADGNSLTYTDLFSAFQDGKNIFLNATSTIQSSTYYYKNIQMSGVDVSVTDPDTAYYISFDFVDSISNDPSTWRVWMVIYDSVDPFIYQINVDKSDADNIRYRNSGSGLTATDVQGAIDELKSDIPADASDVSYDNTSSGLTATDVQDAIDEVKADIPTDLTDLVGSTSRGNVLVYDGASIISEHGWYATDATWIGYDNSSSGLSADYVGDAIDEIADNYLPIDPQGSNNPLVSNLELKKNDNPRYYTKSSSIDCTLSNNGMSSGTYYAGLFNVDTNDTIIGTFETLTSSNGAVSSRLTARNSGTGSQVSNILTIGVYNSGSPFVTISDAAKDAWRVALGLQYPSTGSITLNSAGAYGYVTGANKTLDIFIPMPALLPSATMTITAITGDMRVTPGAYIYASAANYKSYFDTITPISRNNGRVLLIRCANSTETIKTSATGSPTVANNVPVNGSITFTLEFG
jgi:hypothetical protein